MTPTTKHSESTQKKHPLSHFPFFFFFFFYTLYIFGSQGEGPSPTALVTTESVSIIAGGQEITLLK